MISKYYVYTHRRNDTGQVFYVGKGQGDRYKSRWGRNDWWNRVANKHGFTPQIVKWFGSELCAYSYEKALISYIRSMGYTLVNMSDGGEGGLGVESNKRKEVFCDNGMKFSHGTEAAKWLRNNGYPKARQGHIASCARGERSEAYGHVWSYEGVPKPNAMTFREKIETKKGKIVHCSNGITFKSTQRASEWIGGSSRQSRISSAARGETASAYGFAWWYEGDPPKEYSDPEIARSKHFSKPVKCSNGMVFSSGREATKWLRENASPRASAMSVSNCCNGKNLTAYGYTWEFLE